MSYQSALEILADPTRRTLVERMRSGAKPVVELASGLPISRPAVSKHLRVMLEAGLVSVTRDGTRRLYALDLNRLDEVRKWLDGFWDESLKRFKERAEKSTKKGAKDGR
jgi:DNA-binding transcriptional ArsR family regulator